MSARRTERLLNLVIALVSTRRWLTAQDIRRALPEQYPADDPDGGDAAFKRAFERDKADLRELGIELETGSAGFEEVGYRISRRDHALPPVTLAPDEAAAVAMAAGLWSTPQLQQAAERARRKLAAGGADIAPGLERLDVRLDVESGPDPVLLDCVTQRRPVAFAYRSTRTPGAPVRHVQPWGLVSWRGAWYLVGRDTERDQTRVYRLSRLAGPPRPDGPAGTVRVPDGVDLRAAVTAVGSGGAQSRVTLRAAPGAAGAAAGLRRAAVAVTPDPGGDLLEVDVGDLTRFAAWVAEYGEDVEVLGPPAARAAVADHLRAVVSGGSGDGTP